MFVIKIVLKMQTAPAELVVELRDILKPKRIKKDSEPILRDITIESATQENDLSELEYVNLPHSIVRFASNT